MDDPKSRYCLMHREGSFEEYRDVTFGMRVGYYHDMNSRMKVRRKMVKNLLEGPSDPRCYLGWRGRIRNLREHATRLLSRSRVGRKGGGT